VGAPAAPPGPDFRRLAIQLIAEAGAFSRIRGYGFLDLRGTTGGKPDRVERYLAIAHANGGFFPYWTLNLAQKNSIRSGQAVIAQPGPHNGFGTLVPVGPVPFVIMLDGTCRIGPSLRVGAGITTNHCYISQMAIQVAFAGEMRFGGVLPDNENEPRAAAGILISWSNDSGGYRCQGNDATRVGLPMNLYRGTPSASAKDRVDYYGQGRGGKINWGRHGPPEIVRRQQQDYWYR
jgi:hypothetical protein